MPKQVPWAFFVIAIVGWLLSEGKYRKEREGWERKPMMAGDRHTAILTATNELTVNDVIVMQYKEYKVIFTTPQNLEEVKTFYGDNVQFMRANVAFIR